MENCPLFPITFYEDEIFPVISAPNCVTLKGVGNRRLKFKNIRVYQEDDHTVVDGYNSDYQWLFWSMWIIAVLLFISFFIVNHHRIRAIKQLRNGGVDIEISELRNGGMDIEMSTI